jgi:hypothetical protein
MRKVAVVVSIGVAAALVTMFGALAALRFSSAAGSSTSQPSFDPSPVLSTPVVRITQPVQLQTRQTLNPLPDSYVAPTSVDQAFENVPMEVAGLAGQPKAVYLGSVNNTPVYVFRYDFCLPPVGGGAGAGEPGQPSQSVNPCANGATYDAEISADTGAFIVAGQITNPAPGQS